MRVGCTARARARRLSALLDPGHQIAQGLCGDAVIVDEPDLPHARVLLWCERGAEHLRRPVGDHKRYRSPMASPTCARTFSRWATTPLGHTWASLVALTWIILPSKRPEWPVPPPSCGTSKVARWGNTAHRRACTRAFPDPVLKRGPERSPLAVRRMFSKRERIRAGPSPPAAQGRSGTAP